MIIGLDPQIEGSASIQPKDRLPRFQGLDFWQQHIFFEVNPVEVLLQSELRATERF
jgi:hypothetical protein